METSKKRQITIGLSPCPNDTLIFYGLLHGKVPCPYRFKPFMADVEELNQKTLSRSIDISKVSFHVLGHVLDDYVLLRTGSALGRGCGPLLVAKRRICPEELQTSRIAIPGEYTTASLLLKLYAPDVQHLVPMFFADIPEAVAKGSVDAGLIIHESRFTFEELGLTCLRDLGQWWEETTNLPIPLGGIIAKRSLGSSLLLEIEMALRQSVVYGLRNRHEGMAFIRNHAQELSEEVINKHIDLYVTDYTVNIGEDGLKAVKYLLEKGEEITHFNQSHIARFPLTLE